MRGKNLHVLVQGFDALLIEGSLQSLTFKIWLIYKHIHFPIMVICDLQLTFLSGRKQLCLHQNAGI